MITNRTFYLIKKDLMPWAFLSIYLPQDLTIEGGKPQAKHPGFIL
jgi:hypothetical protein